MSDTALVGRGAEQGQITAEFVFGEQPEGDREEHATILGGDPSNPTWAEYLDGFVESFRPHMEAARACVERGDLVGRLASEVCNDHYFRFSDGKTLGLSWRAWGDFMQAIVGKREGYMTYYM